MDKYIIIAVAVFLILSLITAFLSARTLGWRTVRYNSVTNYPSGFSGEYLDLFPDMSCGEVFLSIQLKPEIDTVFETKGVYRVRIVGYSYPEKDLGKTVVVNSVKLLSLSGDLLWAIENEQFNFDIDIVEDVPDKSSIWYVSRGHVDIETSIDLFNSSYERIQVVIGLHVIDKGGVVIGESHISSEFAQVVKNGFLRYGN